MSGKPYKQFYKDKVRWIVPVNTEDFEDERQIILQDLLTKQSNSLTKGI